MRIVYLLVPKLPIQIERARHKLTDAPLVIKGRPWEPEVVLDCCPLAQAAGVAPGMPLARAIARCPEATYLPADHARYHRVQERIGALLRDFSDRLETGGLGIFLMDVTHLRPRFPVEHALLHEIIEALQQALDLEFQLGLAGTRFTAEQAARAARPNTAVVVPPNRGRSFLASLPLETLPIDRDMWRRLTLLGIRTLGDLAALPKMALIRQFGTQAGFLHDLATDSDSRSIYPDTLPPELHREVEFEPPVRDRQRLRHMGERLVAALAHDLQAKGYQAQGLRLEVMDHAGRRRVAATTVEPPSADEQRLRYRLHSLLGRFQPSGELVTLRVTVYPLRPRHLGATQLMLLPPTRNSRWQRLEDMLRRLRRRFGDFVIMVASLVKPPPPIPIEVVLGGNSLPRLLIRREKGTGIRRIYPVRQVYEVWRERRYWWSRPLAHDYYRLEDGTGEVRLVYYDRLNSQWWLERRRW